ncbi:uncharacterized protein LOC124924452 [Impatiens glandulifera]|uniref:uncharacterized protein LOC124924452 n=1 Tax=Impatiens glandulifera TaxID=253017 RepID=UPI001FB06A96|nr:uncharacterized protein LOC124924452 [Impatiens glandulifera]
MTNRVWKGSCHLVLNCFLFSHQKSLKPLIAINTSLSPYNQIRKNPMAMPVLSRLDRLDHLLQFLEEKQGLSSSPRNNENPKHIENFKTISSALEEINRKGTLMERLDILEDRVLKLSMFMDINNNNISKYWSLSPTVEDVSEDSDHSAESSSIPNVEKLNNNKEVSSFQGYEKIKATRKGRNGKRKVVGGLRRYFHMGC